MNALRKDTLREIWKTKNRFISIALIVALGTGFFCGIKMTCPNMKDSADKYYEEQKLSDFHIIGNYGITENDITALSRVEGVATVMPGYSKDVFVSDEKNQYIIKLYSYPTHKKIEDSTFLNKPILIEGKFPEKKNECVVEQTLNSPNSFFVGNTIDFINGDKDSDLEDALNTNFCNIVGVVKSPMYTNFERGSSQIGNGQIDAFVMLAEENFAYDVYTDAYISLEDSFKQSSFSDEYDDLIDIFTDVLEEEGLKRSEIRYKDVVIEANDKIAEAEQELEDGRKEADEKLAEARDKILDAEKELKDGKKTQKEEVEKAQKQLDDAKQELLDGQKEYDKQYADYLEEIEDAKKKIEDGYKELEENQEKINKGWDDYYKGLAKYQASYYDAREQLGQGQSQVNAIRKYSATVKKMTNGEAMTQDDINNLKEMEPMLDQILRAKLKEEITSIMNQYPEETADLDVDEVVNSLADFVMREYKNAINTMKPGDVITDDIERMQDNIDKYLPTLIDILEKRGDLPEEVLDELRNLDIDLISLINEAAKEMDKQANEGQNAIDKGWDKLEKGKASLEQAYKDLTEGQKQIDEGRIELEKGEIELQENIVKAELEFADARIELENGKVEIEDAQKTLDQEVIKSSNKIRDGERKITEAWNEFRDAEEDVARELTDAQEKLEEAKHDVLTLDEAEWFVFDRTLQPGYGDYGLDAERVDNIAAVFPVFFILVAALICLTTMTRMVEEQRTQIGTLKALGYSNQKIMMKYMFYAISASLIGSVIGLCIGFPLFPKIIFDAYSMMYDYPPISTPFHLGMGVAATIVAIICTSVAAYFAGIKELQARPSMLMRPKVPKSGKKIFLERFPRFWNKVSFSYKVTIRNLSRYKSRVALTVIGIGGCTALMVTGFGLQHSISSIADRQFTDIFQYDMMGALEEHLTDKELLSVESTLKYSSEISAYDFIYSKNLDIEDHGEKRAATLFVPSHPEQIADFITFKVRTTQEALELTDEGVIINEKLAKLLNLQVGDVFDIEDRKKKVQVKVTGICENYAMNYVYMTPKYYKELFNKDVEVNAFMANLKEYTEQSQSTAATRIMGNDSVLGLSNVRSIGDTFANLMGSLNVIVVVLILCAGLLAFIVLYNLTNINVNERLRELATIKVLGFYDGEVSAYIYRENTVSAILGILVGLWLGRYLHAFVITVAEVDVVMFDPTIGAKGFIFAALLTFLFTFIVNFVLHFRLKKIDMVESLKSVE